MREFFKKILRALERGDAVELVSVLSAAGSTPRGAGAMLALLGGGEIVGTIGGGNVEYEAQRLAAELLASGDDALREFRFRQGEAASLGMVCGGDVTVQFQFLNPRDETVLAVLRDLLEAGGKNTNTWLLRRLEGEKIVQMGVANRGGTRHLAAEPANLSALLQPHPLLREGWFSLPVVRAGKVYIFGGGHVSQALVPVIAAVGFRPVVYDDRAEFADARLFPAAEAVLCGDFTAISEQISLTADDYVVVMTRGHQADYEVLTQVLRSGVNYVGCIGSRRKLALCRERLLENGFTAEEYRRLHAPIGLAIGAETPAEIAVSIAAELIQLRAGL